jgi:mannose-6-phosphate isomerase-like protein (cupin superfamily)
LREGDAFYFRASVSHRFENPGPKRCSYLAILDYAPLA